MFLIYETHRGLCERNRDKDFGNREALALKHILQEHYLSAQSHSKWTQVKVSRPEELKHDRFTYCSHLKSRQRIFKYIKTNGKDRLKKQGLKTPQWRVFTD